MSKTKIDLLYGFINNYFKDNPIENNDEFITINNYVNFNVRLPLLDYLIKKGKKNIKDRIISYSKVQQDIIPHIYHCDIKKRKSCVIDRNDFNGVIKINILVNGKETYIIVANFQYSMANPRSSTYLLIGGTNDVIIYFYKQMTKLFSQSNKLKPGIYLTQLMMGSTHITKYQNKISNFAFNTSAYNQLESVLKSYFSDNEPKSIGNLPNVGKAFLYGPKGTGKTTMTLQIAKKYERTHIIAICTQMTCMIDVLEKAKYANKPCIIIFEEIDGWVDKNNIVHAEIKNTLAGSTAPNNPHGSFIIMTTNYPDRIANTVLNRRTGTPILVDKMPIDNDLYYIEPIYFHLKQRLKDKEKVEFYGKTIINILKENEMNIKKISHDEIQSIITSIFIYLVNEKIFNPTESHIKKAFKSHFESIKDLKEFNSETENDDY